jgi:hypothetical protein
MGVVDARPMLRWYQSTVKLASFPVDLCQIQSATYDFLMSHRRVARGTAEKAGSRSKLQ